MRQLWNFNSVCIAMICSQACSQPDVLTIESKAGLSEAWNDRGSVESFIDRDGVQRFLGEELGYTGHGVGDVNGDGLDDFAATYYWHVYTSSDPNKDGYDPGDLIPAGDVRVFGHDGTAISQIGGVLKYNDAQYLGRFAHTIRGNADIDGYVEPGGGTRDELIAGSGVAGGISVWTYSDRYTGTLEWVQLMRIRAAQPQHQTTSGAAQRFGWRLAAPRDMNSDGVPDIILGAKGFNEYNPWTRDDNSEFDEGAVFVYCMPDAAWWAKFAKGIDGAPDGKYWENHVNAPHINAGMYDGEPLVNITGDQSDEYYSIRITDPELTRSQVPPINGVHEYHPTETRQSTFGNIVRTATDLDGDGTPDLLAQSANHKHDHDDDETTDPLLTGKVYAYLSSSGVRDQSTDPSNTFGKTVPFLHTAWEYAKDITTILPDTSGGKQLDIKVGDADLVIVGPTPSYSTHGLLYAAGALTEVMPYDDDDMEDVFIGCDERLAQNSFNGYGAFFEIERRVRDLVQLSYPMTPTVWSAPADTSLAGTALNPDRYVFSDEGTLVNIGLAGQMDNWEKCEFWMDLVDVGFAKTQVCAFNPRRNNLNGQFETIWEIRNEATLLDADPCSGQVSHQDGVTIAPDTSPTYPMLEPYEYGLPSSAPGSDQINSGNVSKNISRWWWAGDVDGDGLDDLLGAAWSYPSMFMDGDPAHCNPISGNGSSTDYFRAGKIYSFLSPFIENPIDADKDGVIDQIDACVSAADVNRDGMVTPTDFTAWIHAFNNNEIEADCNLNGVVEPTDFSAWIAAENLGCQ